MSLNILDPDETIETLKGEERRPDSLAKPSAVEKRRTAVVAVQPRSGSNRVGKIPPAGFDIDGIVQVVFVVVATTAAFDFRLFRSVIFTLRAVRAVAENAGNGKILLPLHFSRLSVQGQVFRPTDWAEGVSDPKFTWTGATTRME